MHGLFAVLFSATAARLAREALTLRGAAAALLGICFAAAVILGFMSARTVADLARGRGLRALAGRFSTGVYLQTILGAAALAAGAQRAQMNERGALAAFCAVSALWLLALGLRAVPGQWLSEARLHDYLGRSVALANLTWFRLRVLDAADGAASRVLFEAGDSKRILFRARLAGPAEGLRQSLRRAGLSESLPPLTS